MTDIRDLGGAGKAVFDNAQRLQKANLIDDAQFKELTNTNVGPQDVAIGNAALDKIQSSTPDAMNLMFSIPKMNNQILDLQKQALQQKTAKPEAQPESKSGPFEALQKFMQMLQSMPSQADMIRNIRA